jgi:predicted nucleic acid-binding Zn ribbon protein
MLPINAAARAALAGLIKDTPLSPGKIEFVWRAAVGAPIARVTRVRLDADGALHVESQDKRWAVEIRRSAPLISARLNALLGAGVIKDIKVHHA